MTYLELKKIQSKIGMLDIMRSMGFDEKKYFIRYDRQTLIKYA